MRAFIPLVERTEPNSICTLICSLHNTFFEGLRFSFEQILCKNSRSISRVSSDHFLNPNSISLNQAKTFTVIIYVYHPMKGRLIFMELKVIN